MAIRGMRRSTALSQADVSAFASAVARTHGLDDLWLTLKGSGLVLQVIKVPVAARGQDRAEMALTVITRYADAHGLTLALTPSADFGASKARLMRWYRRHGFVATSGRHKDFLFHETMVRPAR